MRCDVIAGDSATTPTASATLPHHWSGVAALSCGETSGGSSSSSTSSNTGTTEGSDSVSPPSPVSYSPSPSPPGSSQNQQERERKCTNLETLISHKLHSPQANYNNNVLQRGSDKPPACCVPSVDMPSEKFETRILPQMVEASIPKHVIHKVPHRSPTVETIPGDKVRSSEAKLKIQQGRITEYFKSQMKPTNGLKRDIASWIERATNKADMGKTAADNLEMYISYLSQTLNAKMNGVKTDKKPEQNGKHPEKPAENKSTTVTNTVSNISTPADSEKKPLPGLHPISMRNGLKPIVKKPEPIKPTAPIVTEKKTAKRIATSKTTKRNRLSDIKRPKYVDNTKIACKNAESVTNTKIAEKKISSSPDSSTLLNGTTNLASIHEQMRQVFMKVPVHEIKQASADSSKSTGSNDGNDSDKVPSPVHKVSTTVPDQPNTNITNQVIPPPALMLATIRIPQPNMQPPPPLTHVDQSNRQQSHMSMPNPNKLNNQQFVVPMVQNINGALVSIPGIVTKVGQNTMLPIQTHQPNGMVNQQPPQMFINGALLKINTPVHSTLQGGLITKQITATNTTNVSFKNITTGVPTVMPQKQNFTVNLGHPLFATSSGFILNPVNNMITTQTNTCLSHVQQTYGNVVITSPMAQNVHHLAPNINGSIQNLQMPSGNISMASDMNPVFISSPPQQMAKYPTVNDQIVNTTIVNVNSTTDISTTTYVQNDVSVETKSSCISDERVTSATCDTRLPLTESIESPTDNQPTSTNIIETPSPRSRENSSDCVDVDTELCKVNTESLSEEAKSRSDSVSADSLRLIETPSTESPTVEISKEADEDSFLTSASTKDELSTPKKAPVPASDSALFKSPIKIGGVFNQNQKSSRMKASKVSENEDKCCRWQSCNKTFDDVMDLLEHIQHSHVLSQAGKPKFVCLWQTCKVYDRPSCSRHWLERHVMSHGGKKLFKCIVDGCTLRFNTQLAYERHVNNHFDNEDSTVSSAKKSVESSGPKLVKRNGKKMRYRRQPWSARMFDYFDPGIMEGLQYRLTKTTEWRNGGAARLDAANLYNKERNSNCVTMSGSILASRKTESHGHREVFVRWFPEDILNDEWILEKDFKPVKEVKISSLNARARVVLYSGFCSSYRSSSTSSSSSSSSLSSLMSLSSSCESSEKCCNDKPDNWCNINGTSLKILQSHNILNNSTKTDSVNHCITANEPFCRTGVDGNRSKVVGAKKRKQGRR